MVEREKNNSLTNNSYAMSARDTTRFFDTSGCLNLSRPNGNGARVVPAKRPHTTSVPIRGQMKIDLYNFDHLAFVDSKYVLTSPRSLEACARLDVKVEPTFPMTRRYEL
jgi:hypothetical protein